MPNNYLSVLYKHIQTNTRPTTHSSLFQHHFLTTVNVLFGVIFKEINIPLFSLFFTYVLLLFKPWDKIKKNI